jgi:hypothetical protein
VKYRIYLRRVAKSEKLQLKFYQKEDISSRFTELRMSILVDRIREPSTKENVLTRLKLNNCNTRNAYLIVKTK